MITTKRVQIRKIDFARWIVVGVLTAVLLVFMWAAYPGYIFHGFFLSRTISNRSTVTEVLSNQTLTTQYFVPQFPYLRSIQIAVEFEEEKTENEKVAFSLCEESGEALFTCNIALGEMKSGVYYDIVVDQKLKQGAVYYWNITSPTDSTLGWRVMYTENVDDQAPENNLFFVDNSLYGNEDAQTISQYNYYQHLDKAVIIAGFWMSGILVYIICLEIVDRIFKRIP